MRVDEVLDPLLVEGAAVDIVDDGLEGQLRVPEPAPALALQTSKGSRLTTTRGGNSSSHAPHLRTIRRDVHEVGPRRVAGRVVDRVEEERR